MSSEDKPGIRKRLLRYGGKKVLANEIGRSTGFIRSAIADAKGGVDYEGGQSRFKRIWHGPPTEEAGREQYSQVMRQNFGTQEKALEAAAKFSMMMLVYLGVGVFLAIWAIISHGFVFKLSALIAVCILFMSGLMLAHRVSQIKQMRMFGLKEMFQGA